MSIKGPRGVELLQGEQITLKAAGAVTASANGTAVVVSGERVSYEFMLKITASATDAGDTLDVFIDVLGPDGATWINAVHFAQQAGNGSAVTYIAMLTASSTETAPVNVTSDAAAGATRPYVFGSQIRGRWAVVDSGDGNTSHTFSLIGYAV